MGFDEYSRGQPLVNVHKRTTQVNIWMVIGVACFLLIAVVLMMRERRDHGPDPLHQVPADTATPRP